MTDERVKQLMADVGHPDSRSIMQLILQVENETAQKHQKQTAEECRDIAIWHRSIKYLLQSTSPRNLTSKKRTTQKRMKQCIRNDASEI